MEDSRHISALTRVLEVLADLKPDQRRQVLEAATAFYAEGGKQPMELPPPSSMEINLSRYTQIPFSQKQNVTVGEFMLQKRPRTGIARVVCFAFYLKHYLGRSRFDRQDIYELNEAEPAFRVNELSRRILDATEHKYLTKFPDGRREITSRGEILVLSMPEKETAEERSLTHSDEQAVSITRPTNVRGEMLSVRPRRQ